MFFLLILSAIIVAITIVKMLKLLNIWKTDRDLKVMCTFLCLLCFPLGISTVLMKASLALVIRLSLTFTHGTDKARIIELYTKEFQETITELTKRRPGFRRVVFLIEDLSLALGYFTKTRILRQHRRDFPKLVIFLILQNTRQQVILITIARKMRAIKSKT